MPSLPFDLEPLLPNEHFAIGDIRLPKYGSLTPREIKLLSDIFDEDAIVTALDQKIAIVAGITCLRWKEVSRELFQDIPKHLIEGAYDFIINESREWKSQEIEPEITEGKSIGADSTTDSDLTIPMQNSGMLQPTSSELPSNLPIVENSTEQDG